MRGRTTSAWKRRKSATRYLGVSLQDVADRDVGGGNRLERVTVRTSTSGFRPEHALHVDCEPQAASHSDGNRPTGYEIHFRPAGVTGWWNWSRDHILAQSDQHRDFVPQYRLLAPEGSDRWGRARPGASATGVQLTGLEQNRRHEVRVHPVFARGSDDVVVGL